MTALAIAAFSCSGARAGVDCAAPVDIAAPLGEVKPLERVTDYRLKMLESCTRDASKTSALAIRAMVVDGEELLLMVDPESLQTRLERAACWTCREAGPEAKDTRYLKAVEAFAASKGKKLPKNANYLENAGLTHGGDKGAFVTGDLCPSRKPLDRAFLQKLETQKHAPVSLSVTGAWVRHHHEDFTWLRREKAEGRLNILWVNHSFTHPFRPSLPYGENFLLTPGLDPEDEIADVERLLIANGETPSVFFRYPGLISDTAWASRLREAHLIPLGADSWLALTGKAPSPGGVILVHPNGNEPAGLALFDRLNQLGALPKPFRPLMEAP
ncbi:hypothetical protein M2323_004115 [Rhodoblastus acidophilus]|uniref:polysaccharide deacetylase n=1 Tax=Rhodoblastus acidophilus TaxID=1074 RepID=UPI0022245465|nr:polysaccharide deacetylase [Rhodoblastus acidophilus]MCW2286250.1 hypothetical protein [Rhodoblastus acidophilus]MCW2335170.1 hypothetical protein [Rhodoblastus acidophilus]